MRHHFVFHNTRRFWIKLVIILVIVFVLALAANVAAVWYAGTLQASVKENRAISDDLVYQRAMENFNAGLFEAAKSLFLKIEEDSAYYQEVKNRLEEAQNKITDEKISEAVSKVTAELKKETDQAKETAKAAQASASQLQKQAIDDKKKNSEEDLSFIINQWEPRLAQVRCEFRNLRGMVYRINSGSGVAVYSLEGHIEVLTNKHIIQDQFGNGAHLCVANFAGGKSIMTIVNTNTEESPVKISANDDDWGMLRIDNPDEYVKNIVLSKADRCLAKAPVGDSVVILGYPAIGSTTDITATKGIISGYDGSYYITDAKIEHGNSGGAAVLLKQNCYLGIPTFVIVGEIESLARILNQKVIFGN